MSSYESLSLRAMIRSSSVIGGLLSELTAAAYCGDLSLASKVKYPLM
jgi:hypothetical protein